ncbi:uncharacterized protein TNCV_2982131 [Trichonephila clavipes]|nr:uncharacterized protein TNCV_2982131 [Trichonephila clavipes]
MDPRGVIYTKTRLRTPSTDQSSRGPPHRKKCTPSAAIEVQIAPSLGASVSSRTIRRRLAEIAVTITCAALDAHPSTPPFEVVPRTRKLDCSGMEPGRL